MSRRIGFISESFRHWWVRRTIRGPVSRRRRKAGDLNQRLVQIERLEDRTLLSTLSESLSTLPAGSGDFNGDGKTDLYAKDSDTGDINVYLSQGQSLAKSTWDTWSNVDDWETVVGDFNGDGRGDLVSLHTGTATPTPPTGELQVSLSTGSAFTSSIWDTWDPNTSWLDPAVGDFNGDGRDDFAARSQTTGAWQVAISSGIGFTTRTWGSWDTGVAWEDIQVGDFNGDTRDDIVGRDPNSGDWQAAVSTGSDFFGQIWANWVTAIWNDILVGDFDGDGADELVRRSSSHAWQVSDLVGNSFVDAAWGSASPAEEWFHVHVADVNRDGFDDLVGRLNTGSLPWHVALSSGSAFTDQHWQTDAGGEWFTALSTPDIPNVVIVDDTGAFETAIDDFEFVRNNVDFQPYRGSMKGAQATLETLQGNAWDQSALLIDMLESSGLEAKFVIGSVSASGDQLTDVRNWLGTKTDSASANVLFNADILNSFNSTTSVIDFDHVWVETWLPGPAGLGWQPLDPSWKFRDYQDGIPGLLSVVPFDQDAYLSPLVRQYTETFDINNVTGEVRTTGTSYLGERWEEISTGTEIDSQKLQMSLAGWGVALVNDVFARNGTVEADLVVPQGTRAGVIGRWAKNSNGETIHYAAEIENVSGTIWARIIRDVRKGSTVNKQTLEETTLASSPDNGRLRLDMHGDQLKLYFDDMNTPIFTATDPTPLTYAGKTGVFIFRPAGLTTPTIDNFSMSITELRDQHPFEFYEDQVESYLRDNHSGSSLADVPYYGPILSASFDSLPDPPNYSVTASSEIDILTPIDTHRVRISMKDGTGDLFSTLLTVPNVSLQRINVSYVTGTVAGQLIPELRLDGVKLVDGNREITDGNDVTLTFAHYHAGTPNTDPPDQVNEYDRKAGQLLGIGLDAAQTSEKMLQTLRRVLNNHNMQLVLQSHLEVNVRNDPILEDVVENTLALAMAVYWKSINKHKHDAALFTGGLPLYHNVGSGLITADPTVQYHGDRQNFVIPDNILVDLQNVNTVAVSNITDPVDIWNARLDLIGWQASFMEHAIVENLFNIEGVSTMKGLQWAEDNGVRIYEFKHNGTDIVDLRTGQIIIGSIADALDLSKPSHESTIESLILSGDIVWVPQADIHINEWSGIVYISQQEDENGVRGGFSYAMDKANGGAASTDQLVQLPPKREQNTAQITFTGDPVDVANGNMFRDETDIVRPSIGVPLRFSRHYDSQSQDDSGLGVGWSYSYGDRLEIETDKAVWRTSDGGSHSFFKDLAGNFETPAALLGSTLTFDAGTAEYTLRQKHGLKHIFDANGRLLNIRDSNNQSLDISYDTAGRISQVSNRNLDLLTFEHNPATALSRKASDLDELHDFQLSEGYLENDYWYNLRGVEERYLSGFYILPTGDLYEWGGSIAASTYIDTLDSSYHTNPSLLVDAFDPVAKLAFDLDQQRDFTLTPGYRDTNYWFNLRGANEKYLTGYFILPNGDLHRWDGAIETSLKIATLDTRYYSEPSLLVNAPRYVSKTEIHAADDPVAHLTYRLDKEKDFELDLGAEENNYWFNQRGANEKYLKGFFILPNGELYRWDGAIEVSLLIDTLDSRYHDDPSLLIDVYDPAAGRAYDLDQRYDFTVLPGSVENNYWFNDRGLNEKYLTGYYILENGDLYKWGGSIAASVYVDTLDSSYHDDPSRLVDVGYPVAAAGNEPFELKRWTYNFETLSDGKQYLRRVIHPSDIDTPITMVDYDYIDDGGPLQGFINKITEPSGGTHVYSYFVNGRAFEVTDQEGFTTHLTYDLFRNITEFTDERGFATTYDHNPRGLLERMTNPDRTRVIRQWDDDKMLLLSSTDAFGNAEQYLYDSNGNLTKLTERDGLITDSQYDATFNRPTVITKAPGTADEQVTTLQYDTSGNLIQITDALDNVTTMTYYDDVEFDGVFEGLLKTRVGPKGNLGGANPVDYTHTFEYNNFGLLSREILPHPDGSAAGTPPEVTFTFDQWNNVLSQTDPTGFDARFEYDALNRRIKEIVDDPDGPGEFITSFSYDSRGNVVSATDANGVTTSNVYDLKDNLVETRFAGGTFVKNTYDGAKNLIQTTDALRRTTRFTVDSRNRRVQTLLPDGSVNRVHLDGEGRTVAAFDENGNRSSFSYDKAGRLLSTTDALGNSAETTYNVLGNLETATDFRGNITTFEYDGLNRVIETRGPEGLVTTTDYDTNGNVERETRYDVTGLTTIPADPRELDGSLHRSTMFEYDFLDRPKKVTDPAGNFSTTTYDFAGRVLSVTDQLGRTTVFGYDAIGRRISETGPDPDGPSNPAQPPFTSFQYDAVGNLISTTDAEGRTTSFEYDHRNRLVKATDANGGVGESVYDVSGQLVATVDALGRSALTVYDSRGRQIKTIAPDPDREGMQLAPVSQVEYDAAGNVTTRRDALGRAVKQVYDDLNRPIVTTVALDNDPAAAAAVIVDDSDTSSFSVTGTWTTALTGGYSGQVHINAAGTGSEVATWTFNGLRPGHYYRVLATWDDGADAVVDAEFIVKDGATELAAVVVDQTIPVRDNAIGQRSAEFAEGVNWLEFGTFYLEGDTLIVELPDKGQNPDFETAFVVADAIRVEEVGFDSSVPVSTFRYDETSNLIATTDPLGRITTFEYDGQNRTTKETLPDPDLNDAQPAPFSTFQYDALGNVVSTTDGEGRTTSFEYDVLNRQIHEILPNAAAAQDVPIILDDGETGFTAPSSNWTASSSGYQNDSLTNSDGSGEKAVWEFTGLEPGFYRIAATWFADAGNDTSAPYAVFDDTEPLQTVTVDQTVAPDDFNESGTNWEFLGEGFYVTSGTLRIELTDNSAGLATVADAIRLTQHGPTTTLTYDAVGNLLSSTDPLGRATTFVYDDLNRRTTRTLPDPDGSGGSLQAPVTTWKYDAVGNVLAVTDHLDRTTSFEYDVLNRQIREILLNADAAQDVPVILDDDAVEGTVTGFSKSGTWSTVLSGYQGDSLTNSNESTAKATWEFTGLEPGFYRVAASWIGDTGNYDAAAYSVLDGSQSLQTVTIDQKVNPDDFMDSGSNWWEFLGEGFYITSGTLKVELAGSPNTELVVADAIRLTQHGPTTTLTYDAVGNLLSSTDPLGRATTFVYDDLNRRTTRTLPDPDGSGGSLQAPVTTWKYDAVGNVLAVTDHLGRTTSFEYDSRNRQTKEILPDPDGEGVGDPAPETTFEYDDVGNLITQTNARGFATTFQYDRLDRLIKETLPDPDGTGNSLLRPSTTWAYDNVGNVLTVTDHLDRTTTTLYDRLNRPISETLPDPDGPDPVTQPLQGPVTTWTYDAAGNVLAVSDHLGRTTSFEYDNLDRQTKETLPDPDDPGTGQSEPVSVFVYNDAGNLAKQIDALGGETLFEYDRLDRTTKETLPDPDGVGSGDPAPETTFVYDVAGNLLSEANQLGETTSFQYDALDRRTAVTDPNSDTTQFVFDDAGNLFKVIDPVSNETTYLYDDLDRLLSETNQLGKTRSFTYDALGNTLTITDRIGRVREFDYDPLDRVTHERWKTPAPDLTLVNTVIFTYNDKGLLSRLEDNGSLYKYTYDDLDRLLTISNAGLAGAFSFTLTSTYNNAGNRGSLTAVHNGFTDFVTSYTYDNLDRMTRITQTDGDPANGAIVSDKRVDLAYNALGQFTSITRYEHLTDTAKLVANSTYGYDGTHRLESLTHARGASTLADYTFGFDAASRITSLVATDSTATVDTTTVTYDPTGQVTAATHTAQTDENYDYDANGNRDSAGYSTGPNNQLLTDGTYNYEYDDEGNRTKRTEIATGDYVEYFWDHRNRLTTVKFWDNTVPPTLSKQVAYTYDVDDLRIRKRIDSNGDGVFNQGLRYAYDGSDTVIVFDTDVGALQRRYLHGPEVDQVFADENQWGSMLWSLTDHLGTVRDVADYDTTTDTTAVVNHLTYDSFGSITAESGPGGTPLYAFTGREWDADADLYYYRARWYDPVAGRFVSEDPTGFDGGDVNLARYVGNSPYNFTDPTGRQLATPTAIATSALGFGNPLAGVNLSVATAIDFARSAASSSRSQSSSIGAGSDFFSSAAGRAAIATLGLPFGGLPTGGSSSSSSSSSSGSFFGSVFEGARDIIGEGFSQTASFARSTAQEVGQFFGGTANHAGTVDIDERIISLLTEELSRGRAGASESELLLAFADGGSSGESLNDKVANRVLLRKRLLKEHGASPGEFSDKAEDNFNRIVPGLLAGGTFAGAAAPVIMQELALALVPGDEVVRVSVKGGKFFFGLFGRSKHLVVETGEGVFKKLTATQTKKLGEHFVEQGRISRADDFNGIARELQKDVRAFRAVADAGETAKKFLGPNSRGFRNDAGDLVFESKNGLKQIRFDFNRTHPHKNPHTHIIEFKIIKNKKVKIRDQRISPSDLPPE